MCTEQPSPQAGESTLTDTLTTTINRYNKLLQ